jgi:hypothetical protein
VTTNETDTTLSKGLAQAHFSKQENLDYLTFACKVTNCLQIKVFAKSSTRKIVMVRRAAQTITTTFAFTWIPRAMHLMCVGRRMWCYYGIWLLTLTIAARAQTTTTTTATPSVLALTASSPFQMWLHPTPRSLDYKALQVLEAAIVATLATEQDNKSFLDLEAVLQQVQLVPPRDSGAASTTLQFFVLATIDSAPEEEETDKRLELNELIQSVFVDSVIGLHQLVETLQDGASVSLLLSNVTDVWVAPVPTVSAASDSTSSSTLLSKKTLTTLDISLIVMSGLIFCGILYMIIQHHKDRGFIENERMRAFSQPVPSYSSPPSVAGSHDTILMSPKMLTTGHFGLDNLFIHHNGSHLSPSTPSTSVSNDYGLSNTAPTTPTRSVTPGSASLATGRLSSMFPSILPPSLLVVVNEDDDEEDEEPEEMTSTTSQSLAETFDSNVFADGSWSSDLSKKKKEKSVVMIVEQRDDHDASAIEDDLHGNDGHHYYDKDMESANEEDDDDDTDSSVDLFRIDVEAATSAVVPDDKSSVASAVSEWMKSIQVISSDTKTSEMTQSTMEHSSMDRSEQSSLGVESLDPMDMLEKSMASSQDSVGPESRLDPIVERVTV